MTNLKLTTRNLPDFYKTTVGFDRVFNELERRFANSVSTGYPPYNIIRMSETDYLIELAVAGFDLEDFDIQLHDSVLTIKVDVADVEEEGVEFIHKGISARNFERSFQLADTVKVEDAYLKQGLLSIKLVNEIPEEKKPRQISIKSYD